MENFRDILGKIRISKKQMASVFFMLGILALTLSTIFLITSQLRGLDLSEVFGTFFSSSVGSIDSFFRTLMRTTFLLISTLGLMVAFRSGVWNIGAEGQIALGAIVTTGICLFLSLPPILTIFLVFIASFFISGAYACLAGYLREKWGVSVIVVTVMQIFIVFAILNYLVDGPWFRGVGVIPRTANIPPEMRLPFISSLNFMFFIALALIPVVYFLINKSVLGYEMRVVGSNRRVASSQGINVKRLTLLSMLISGGLCGISGVGLILGELFYLQAGVSGNYGFYAIAAAFIARNRPKLALFSSLLIAFIYQGILGLTILGIPRRLGEAIIGLTFIIALLPEIVKRLR